MRLIISQAFILLLTSSGLAQEEVTGKAPSFTTGIDRPEDLIPMPGTSWVLASGMSPAPGKPGRLHAVRSTDRHEAREIFPASARPSEPDRAGFPGGLGEPDVRTFAPHGINVRRVAAGRWRLYVVNHGGREAVEVFDLDLADEAPRVRWRGAIPMPPNTWPNGVASNGQGEVYVTSMYDPADDYLGRWAAGRPTGYVWRWSARSGWSHAADVMLSAANGVEVSADGRWLFVSEWAARKLWRFSLVGAPDERVVAFDFLTDNLRWTPEGRLLVAGQNSTPEALFGCESRPGMPCPTAYTVAEVDPATMRQRILIRGGDDRFGGGTVATRVGREIWVGTFRGDRIARFPAEGSKQ
jgi:hypothetical protein